MDKNDIFEVSNDIFGVHNDIFGVRNGIFGVRNWKNKQKKQNISPIFFRNLVIEFPRYIGCQTKLIKFLLLFYYLGLINLRTMNDIQSIIFELVKFRDERNWSQFHNTKDIALARSIEMVSMLRILFLKK